MQISYLSDMVYSTDFVYILVILTFVIWAVMKMLFNYDSFAKSLMFAIMALIFLPFIASASQFGSALIMVLIIGGLAISQSFKWPLVTSIMALLIAILAGMAVLPAL